MIRSAFLCKALLLFVMATATACWCPRIISVGRRTVRNAPVYSNNVCQISTLSSSSSFSSQRCSRGGSRFPQTSRRLHRCAAAAAATAPQCGPTEVVVAPTNTETTASPNNVSSNLITYMTDVEGDRDYLYRYVRQSKVLCWRNYSAKSCTDDDHDRDDGVWKPDNSTAFPFPYNHCIDFRDKATGILVYGGDVWDQGGSDLYVVRQLLHLKRRYATQVHFIMGNRDINKMRIVQEIGCAGLDDDLLPVHNGVYMLKGTGRVGDPDLGPLPHRTAVERLQWILANTMGSPRAFAFRKWELQQERTADGQVDSVSDADVVESYRKSCDPVMGEISLYLQSACLALRLGDVAFLHGALPFTSDNLLANHGGTSLWDDLTFAMPWLKPGVAARDVGVESIDEWMDALNTFARDQVEAWVACRGESGGIWSWKGGYQCQSQLYGQLMQYGMGTNPDRVRNPTVVYNSWGVAGQPRKFFRHDVNCREDQSFVRCTNDFFQRANLSLICSGHQPAGEMPNHIRVDGADRTSWILCCDTSYSGDTAWLNLTSDSVSRTRKNLGRGDAKSGRGAVAVSEVLIQQCNVSGSVLDAYCHGTLSDGTNYRSQSLDFSAATTVFADGLEVGTLASGKLVPSESESPHGGPWWTQAALTDNSVLLAAGKGFQFWTRMVLP